MVRVVTQYQCGICQTVYADEADAVACEAQGVPTPRLAAGDFVFAGSGFGWYDGDARWVSNPRVKLRPRPCPNGNGNCFEPCCTYRFYYVVTAADLEVGDYYPVGDRHRTRYHLFTNAMTGKQGYRSGYTYDRHHKTARRVEAPAKLRADARDLLGQRAECLL